MGNNKESSSDISETNLIRYQMVPLFFLTSIFFLNFTIRIILSPLLPTIKADMGLTHDQVGSFFLISASGYFISLLCSGFVSSKIMHKKTIVLSAVASGLAFLLTGLSPNLAAMRVGLFVVGATAALYLPSGMAMLTSTIHQDHWGKAIGIHEIAPNLSFLLAPIICEGLLLFVSWRDVLVSVGCVSILLGFLFFKFSNVKDFAGEPPMLSSFLPLVRTPSFWMMVVLFSLGVTGTLGIYSMLPLFLVNEHNMMQSEANTLITMSRILTLPMALFVGWLSDHFGLKRTLGSIVFLTGILTLLIGLAPSEYIKIIIFFQPMFAVCFFPPAFAALSQIGSKETRNILISFTVPIAFLAGGGLVPNIIGILGENGVFPIGFIGAGTLMALGSIIPFFLALEKQNE